MRAMRSLESRAPAPGGLVVSRVSQTRREAAQLRLHALLDACLAYERCRFIRGELVTLLAASSAGVWMAAVRPGLLPASETRGGPVAPAGLPHRDGVGYHLLTEVAVKPLRPRPR